MIVTMAEPIPALDMLFIDGLVLETSIQNQQQARACVDFLRIELQRHIKAQEQAARWSAYHNHEATVDSRPGWQEYHRSSALFYQSAVDRHQPDIEATRAKLERVSRRWHLLAGGFEWK